MINQKNIINPIIGALMLIMAFFIVFGFLPSISFANNVSTLVEVTNVTPTMSNVRLCDGYSYSCTGLSSLILQAGTVTSNKYVVGEIADNNGIEDIDQLIVRLHRTWVQEDCDEDDNNCYHVADEVNLGGSGNPADGCSFTQLSTTSYFFYCPVNVQYFADPTDSSAPDYSGDIWHAYAKVIDQDNTYSTSSEAYGEVEVNTLNAIETCSNISFGNIDNNASTSSGNAYDCAITNKGNIQLDLSFGGTDMSCETYTGSGVASGTIPINNLIIDVNDLSYSGMQSNGTYKTLSNTASIYTNANGLVKPTSTTLVVEHIYNAIHVPYNVVGNCTGTNIITSSMH